MATIPELFDLAVRYHQVGDLRQAEPLYRQILQADPAHADALHLLGILAYQSGRRQEAVACIRLAIALKPTNAAFHYDLGIIHGEQGQATEAIDCYRSALRINPNHADAHNNLGNILKDLGQLDEAVHCFRQALRVNPSHGKAHFNLGNVLFMQGRLAEAVECYRQSLRFNPSNADAHNNLANALFGQGQFAEAAGFYLQALRLNPNHAEAFFNLGNTLFRLGQLAEAAKCYRQALGSSLNHAEAHYNLGNILVEQKQLVEAVQCYRQTLRINANHAMAHNNLANVLNKLGRKQEAAAAYQEALRLEPERPEILYNLGTFHHEQEELDQAVACVTVALRLKPNSPDASSNLAEILKEQGLLDDAIAQFRQTLELQPNHAFATYNLSELAATGHYQFPPAQIEIIKAFLALGNCPPSDRDLFCFTLAAVLDQQGAYDEAFGFYQQANDFRKHHFEENNLAFDGKKHQALVDRLIATYDSGYFQRVQAWGTDSELPIFIIGMPRSGSTLVEQILASHPQVFGAGEFGEVPRFASRLAMTPQAELYDSPVLPDERAARELAASYLESITKPAREAARVINKTLDNFLHLGVIATLFPRARIIHCRREPLDVCLSCFFHNFKELSFTCSLEDIGTWHGCYEKLMAHWAWRLPLPIHEVRYEELVHHQREVTEKLLAFCGLNWDDRCLAFHKTRRPVRTSSAVQVRKPVSTQAIGRWEHYRAHLEPLFKALGVMPR